MSSCPLMNIEIAGNKCPVNKCLYKSLSTSECIYHKFMAEVEMTHEEISEATGVGLRDVERLARAGLKRIQIAVTIDAYLDTLSDIRKKTVNNDVPSVLRIFNLHTDDLPKVLNEDRYQKWKNRSGVDITFEEVSTLLNLR